MKIFMKYREEIMYIMMGLITTLIYWGSYLVFVDFIFLDLNVSNILSWFVAVLFAFVVNKWYVFEAKSLKPSTVIREIIIFFISRILTGIVAWILFPLLLFFGIDGFFETPGFLAKILTSFVEIVLNWYLSKKVVFHKTN